MRDQDFFWDGAKEGKLLAQQCSSCGHVRHPPGPACPKCQSFDWKPKALSGRGVVDAWLISKHPTQPDPNPRLVVLLVLDEGLRMVSNLVDCDLADVTLGAPVEVLYRDMGNGMMPVFKLSKGA